MGFFLVFPSIITNFAGRNDMVKKKDKTNNIINPLNNKENEKKHCCRKLENEQNPSRRY